MNIMLKRTLVSSVVVVASALAAPAWAAPQTYVIDGSHTFPSFSYNHFGLSMQVSRFNKTSGTVVYDAAAGTAEVDIVIDTRSVETGSETFNGHIQGEDFLHTEAYPEARFKSTRTVFEAGKPVAVEGNLTIKGVTHPVTLTLTSFAEMPHPMLQKDAIGANATTTISRTAFNAGKYAPNVGDDVTITISLEAIAQ